MTYVPHEKQIDKSLKERAFSKKNMDAFGKALAATLNASMKPKKKLTTEEKQAKCKHDGKIDYEILSGIRSYDGIGKYCHKCSKFLGFLTQEEEKEHFKTQVIVG